MLAKIAGFYWQEMRVDGSIFSNNVDNVGIIKDRENKTVVVSALRGSKLLILLKTLSIDLSSWKQRQYAPPR